MSHLSWILGYLTVPGAVMRAFLEHLLCKILRVPVEDTAYLHRSELFGHVEHEPVRKSGRSFALCLAPGLLLFLLGAVTAGAAVMQLTILDAQPISVTTGKISVPFILCCVLLYLGICMLCNVFPSYEDALYLWESCETAKKPVRALLFPLAACMRAGAFLGRFGVWQFVYALLTAVLFVFF